MKVRLFFFFLVMFPLLVQGQLNLIPNSGFEDSISCQNTNGSYRPNNWYSPTDGTPDYFLQTQTNNTGCTDSFPDRWGGGKYMNNWGYQTPRSGNGYVGCVLPKLGEHLAIELMDSLEVGKRYEVSCYISLANISSNTIDLIQFELTPNKWATYFSVDGGGTFQPFVPDCSNQSGNFILDTLGWTLLTDTFMAAGGEKFLTVGNFDTTATQYYLIDSSNLSPGAYYYFDDFDFHCIDCIADTFEPPAYPEIIVTPNIGNGEITLSGNFPEGTKFEVYDLLGQLVYYNELQNGNQTQQIFLQLAEGVYSYRVVSNNNVLKADKLVVVL